MSELEHGFFSASNLKSSQIYSTDVFTTRETGFITPSQPFDIVIIVERSPKKQTYFWLYNAVWVHLNVSIGGCKPRPALSSSQCGGLGLMCMGCKPRPA